MGHLFSRAIKRLTFGGSSSRSASRNPLPDNEQQDQAAGQSSSRGEPDLNRPTVQAIPVGQSIDSAEYAAFENASSALPPREDRRDGLAEQSTQQASRGDTAIDQGVDLEVDNEEIEELIDAMSDQSKPEVEEAVIKIQALVRGHLTRKALKDAQQQAASVAPNALGQCQFDEESLIKNPPSAIFLPSSPLNPGPPDTEAMDSGTGANQLQQQPPSSKHTNSRVPPLESIAEDDIEITTGDQDEHGAAISEQGQKRRLLSKNQMSSATTSSSNDGIPASPSSPQPPSTANASIDIHCDTPASVSIDIMDHSSKPTFGLASVLYHGAAAPTEQGQESSSAVERDLQRTEDDEVDVLPDISGIPSAGVSSFDNNITAASSLPASPPHINLATATTNSHSIDSAEAAAIRIQSAFRGYHTRKHSPYRRRSPASASVPQTNGYGSHANGRHVRGNFLRQQDATAMDDGDDDAEGNDDEGVEGCERLGATSALQEDAEDEEILLPSERLQEQEESANRQSRQRHRVDEAAQLAEDLANTVLEDDEVAAVADDTKDNDRQRANELESDNIERRNPSGCASEDRTEDSPQIKTDSFDQQPALVSSSSFEDDQRRQSEEAAVGDADEQQRLEVVSPDEAIGSGRSSPALISSNGENSSDDEAAYLDEEPGGTTQTEGESPQQGGSGAGGSGKSKKRNRNKRNKNKK